MRGLIYWHVGGEVSFCIEHQAPLGQSAAGNVVVRFQLMNRPRFAFLATMISTAALSRLLPHPPNVTPLAAMALFGGAHFADKRLAFLAPLAALLLSDLILGLHSQMPGVYAGFTLVVCVGFGLRGRTRALPVAVAALIGSCVFYLVSNFGWWVTTGAYPKTMAGLGACYVAGIPFFRNSLAGDLFYTALLFGIFALAETRFALLRNPVPAGVA